MEMFLWGCLVIMILFYFGVIIFNVVSFLLVIQFEKKIREDNNSLSHILPTR